MAIFLLDFLETGFPLTGSTATQSSSSFGSPSSGVGSSLFSRGGCGYINFFMSICIHVRASLLSFTVIYFTTNLIQCTSCCVGLFSCILLRFV